MIGHLFEIFHVSNLIYLGIYLLDLADNLILLSLDTCVLPKKIETSIYVELKFIQNPGS